ncbi:MAG: hypothetical protein IKD61_01720 [Oscillospiraceae bacterium]|nr:hypothetical protein [Oscillospiraceae bacterium]
MFRKIGILLLALAMIAANALAEAEFAAVADVNEAKELSALYGRNIADAAAEVGGLSYKSGDELTTTTKTTAWPCGGAAARWR